MEKYTKIIFALVLMTFFISIKSYSQPTPTPTPGGGSGDGYHFSLGYSVGCYLGGQRAQTIYQNTISWAAGAGLYYYREGVISGWGACYTPPASNGSCANITVLTPNYSTSLVSDGFGGYFVNYAPEPGGTRTHSGCDIVSMNLHNPL